MGGQGFISMPGEGTWAQNAVFQQAGARGGRKSAAKRKRRSASGARPAKRKSTGKRRKRAKKGAHLVKGSAAAKAWGKRMKRLRKR